ncbi:hypothetical protein AND_008006 [Anopheles darlingi]|uniref:Coilin N-terminal domain-containing protein n=1 Tax=Anopheles darlingi TaxID=43151 RepID=W5JBW5_ANODA|nr:hypothetical protein AND_008006 [Anopheles darlingi]
MKKYVLDLSYTFSDHRRKICIGRRPEWTAVGQLKQAVADLFHIPSEVFVCCEHGIYYPDTEHIDILPESVTLKFVTAQKEASNSDSEESVKIVTAPKRKSCDQQINGSNEIFLLDIPKPKRRRVRKRKLSAAAKASKLSEDTSDEVVIQAENGQPEAKLKSPAKEPRIESRIADVVVVVPFRNLRTELKARVVRAISPSIPEPPAHHNGISNGGENHATVGTRSPEPSGAEEESSVPTVNGNAAGEITAV